ncbi:DUF1828 domain-containing protein [Azospirillum brasilense]|nr:DUF1828 domain-containing protein [Azospirillum brasilense]
MPVIYPNGQAVNVLVTVEAGQHVVHDAGAGAMFLTLSGVELTKRLRSRLAQLAHQYGCEFIDGRMSMRCMADQLAVAIVLVANASRVVGDQALRAAAEHAEIFREAVSSRLRELVGTRLREREAIVGSSGREYRVGNIILDRAEKAPIAFVEAVPNQQAVERRVSEFLDLKEEYPEIARESVYDDRVEWENHSLILLKHVSNPVPFSRSELRIKAIAA